MKKSYVTPDIQMLDLAETSCFKYKEILSSTGDVIGYERVEEQYTKKNAVYKVFRPW